MIRTSTIQVRLLSTAFVAILLAGGAATMAAQNLRAAPIAAVPAADTAAGQNSPADPQLEQRNPRYVIQQQDVLLLSFPITPEMNQTVTVQPDGYINLQNGNSLHARGLTVPELVQAIKKAYVGTLHNPIINVDLKDFQKPFFTVSGQVGRPGQYDLRADITVAEAIAVAGGLEPTAKSPIFLFHRTSEGWFQVKKVDMKDVLNGKKVNEDATLKPGDMIYVPEKFITNFRKYIPYSLNAGEYLQQEPF